MDSIFVVATKTATVSLKMEFPNRTLSQVRVSKSVDGRTLCGDRNCRSMDFEAQNSGKAWMGKFVV